MSSHARQLFDPDAAPGPSGAADAAEQDAAVLTIGALYGEVEGALASAFPRRRPLWVRGEIHALSDQTRRSGHCYFDLIDPDEPGRNRWQGKAVPTLKVKCWKDTWAPLKASLALEGIELAEGMVVVLRGSLNLYRPKGEIGFVLAELDVAALLGGMAARREALLKKLEAEGLLRMNAALALPDVVTRIGLVASPGSEGYHDFLGQLTASGFAFDVKVVPVSVQGSAAPGAIATAIRALNRSECEVIVVVRGGGAKADLIAFETEVVARSIAHAEKPVWTGIGHTGDETIADIVASRVCITPTECGQQLVVRLGSWWAEHVGEPAAGLAERVPAFLAAAEARDQQARGRLTRAARMQLRVHRERVARGSAQLARLAPMCVAHQFAAVRGHSARLGPLAGGHVTRGEERVRGWRRLLAAYDVTRQLERGYSLTTGEDGRLVRSVSEVKEGDRVTTRLADGQVRSTVTATETERNDVS